MRYTSSLTEYAFSCIPEKARVSIAVDGTLIYSEILASYRGIMTIYRPDTIIEQYMRDEGLSVATLTVTAEHVTGGQFYTSSTPILYCAVIHPDTDPLVLARDRFLTSADARSLPATFSVPLSLVDISGDTAKATLTAFVSSGTSDEITKIITDIQLKSESQYLRTILISSSDITSRATQILGTPEYDIRIRRFSVRAGDRSIEYFIDPNLRHAAQFTYRNIYNAPETIYLNISNTVKDTLEQSEAAVAGETIMYDRRTARKYQTVAPALMKSDADCISQMLNSHHIMIAVTPTHSEKILITEYDCDITDNPENLNEVKFTWRFAAARTVMPVSPSDRIFTSPFDITFS